MNSITNDILLLFITVAFVAASFGLAFHFIVMAICEYMQVKHGINIIKEAFDEQQDPDDPTF